MAEPDAARLSGSGGQFAVQGALTFATVRELESQGRRLLGDAAGQAVQVDLQGVTRADSAGLALLVGWLAQARAVGVQLRFEGVPQRLLAIAQISEVDSLLGVPAG